MNIGIQFEALVMSFKMQKLPFLLMLSVHFVVTNQLEQEKRSVKKFIMGNDWDDPGPKGNFKIDFDADGFDTAMSPPFGDHLKRVDCLTSCEIGSATRKQAFQVMPFQSEVDQPSKDVICVRKSCIPGIPSVKSHNEPDVLMKNFLKDAGWEEIVPEVKHLPKHEDTDKTHYDISLKHEISVEHQMKDSAIQTSGDRKSEKNYPKHEIVFEAMHVVKKVTRKPVVAVEGHWMSWSLWSPCTTTCDVGVQSRKRMCIPANSKCKFPYVEKRICIRKTCHQAGKKSTLNLLQGRDANLRCYGRNINMKNIGLVWITPYGKIIRPSNDTKSRIHAIDDLLHIDSVQKLDSGLYHCIWPPLKTGTGLMLEVETCDSLPCKNSGNCLESFIDRSLMKQTTCVCSKNYRGPRCDRKKSNPRRTSVIFIAIIVCILVLAIVFLCCCLRRRKKTELPEKEIVELYLDFDRRRTLSIKSKGKK